MSPFLDDSDDETRSNILRCDFSFPDSCCCSTQGRDLVARLLLLEPGARSSAPSALTSSWLRSSPPNLISSRLLSNFNNRRRRIFNSLPPVHRLNQ